MAKQTIMDHSGHSVHEFDPADKLSTEQAEARFQEFLGKGFTVAKKAQDGKFHVTKTFDPTAEETLFIPRLQGG